MVFPLNHHSTTMKSAQLLLLALNPQTPRQQSLAFAVVVHRNLCGDPQRRSMGSASGKPWENHRKMVIQWDFIVFSWDFIVF